jgi:class 3 adenylate cyclase/CHASE2 domain-containing sensor protein
VPLRRYLVALGIAAAAAAAASVLVSARFFDGTVGELERKTVDYRMRAAASPDRDSAAIALVLFDTMSVDAWPYLMPFPRTVLADLVLTAAANGAAVIGLDVFLDRRYPELSAWDDGDRRLRDAIAEAGNVVLVAATVQQGRTRRLLAPDPYFADAAAAVATADLPTPSDWSRDVALAVRTEQGLVPGFALALYGLMQGLDMDSLLLRADVSGRLHLPGLSERHSRVAADGATTLPILYRGPPSRPNREEGTFLVYPADAVRGLGLAAGFQPTPVLSAWLGGRAVLLGSGFHDSDRFRSPFYDHVFADGELAGWTYGVEVHANALQNLLQGQHLRPLPQPWLTLLLFLVALVAAGMTFWRGAKWGAVAGGSVAGVAVWLALEAFSRGAIVMPGVGPVLAFVFAYTGAAGYVSLVEGREKRMIRSAFSKYVPPDVVADLVADPSRLKLGGEKREVSILFGDLAGFTSMAEVLEPELLVSILNDYLAEMSDIVFDEGGTLDKYIGDAIMALWGAPTPVNDHALLACRAAVRMQRRLAALNDQWRERGSSWPPLRMRIGINTGTPVVGNIGGQRRFDYTALGDAVNLAARLEPACKTYGVGTMIGEATRRAAGARVVVRELDMLAVYGKADPVRVYELIGLANDTLPAAAAELIEQYEAGLAAYRRRDFELAVSYFAAALQIQPLDRPSRLYRDRSADCILNPPPADWDFVERRQVK